MREKIVDKQERLDWAKKNACKFCQGSQLHTCNGYYCSDAIKKAEEYFEKAKGRRKREEKTEESGDAAVER